MNLPARLKASRKPPNWKARLLFPRLHHSLAAWRASVVPKATKATKATRATRAIKVTKVIQGHRVHKAKRGIKETKEIRATPVQPGLRDHKARKENREKRETKGKKVTPGHKDRQVLTGVMARMAKTVHREPTELMDTMVQMVRMVPTVFPLP